MRKGPYRAATLSVAMFLVLMCATTVSVVMANPHPAMAADTDQPSQSLGLDKARLVPGPIVGNLPVTPLHDSMRQMWVDHCVWSRMVTMSVLGDMKGCEAYEDRLARNVTDFGALLKPYYGPGAEKFQILFNKHIVIGGQVLYALRSDDQTLFRDVIKDWYANADDIAALLTELNPKYWRYDEMRTMWSMHLDTVLDQALQFHKGDWPIDVVSYDLMQDHALRMADYLSEGILWQFPQEK